MSQASITFVSGGSGGVGKSSTARMLAHTLGLAGYRTVLVDGNPGQQSQRVYLNVDESYSLEMVFTQGLPQALAGPRTTHSAFALLAGPADPYADDVNDMYRESIIALRPLCDMIIIDSDRTDALQWHDPHSFSGAVTHPFLQHGDGLLVFKIGQSGSQTDDGLAALDAIGLPDRTVAISQCAPDSKPWHPRRWNELLDGMAEYGGCDQWTRDSRLLIDRHRPGWPKGKEPAWLRSLAVRAGGERDRLRAGGRSWTR